MAKSADGEGGARLVWFRSDLRVMDNTALAEAATQSFAGKVYGVFFITVQQWREHDWGDPKIAFTLRSLHALQKNLAELGIPLLIFERDSFAEIPEALVAVAAQCSATSVYANHEYEVNERRRDERVAESLLEHGVSFLLFHDQTCLAPNDPELRTGKGDPYTVFTPFKKRFISLLEDRGMPSVRPRPQQRSAPEKPSELSYAPPLPDLFPALDLFEEEWPGGEREGLEALKKFSDSAISSYHEKRDYPWHPGTSRLSPYLAVGAISPRKCLAYAVRAGNDELSLEKSGPMVWASEIIWREFYRHVLLFQERVCKGRAFRESVDEAVEWRYDEEQFERWSSGMTGYPIIDAAMRQLNTTGWMHNRLRMVVAMFLTKHLLIDWRWGERYFNEKLVDADFASNNGGWQWSSSTGTDAQPYFRIFNPYSQSSRYDSKGEFIKTYCPELQGLSTASLHHPSEEEAKKAGYPLPMIEHEEGRDRALEAFGKD
ncbi:deoxyribodipyrimidine photo-lyase [bacterium]|nr:deoxyribodipyrimidine photo-lyase [bacterium]